MLNEALLQIQSKAEVSRSKMKSELIFKELTGIELPDSSHYGCTLPRSADEN